jgi:nitrogen-specific signal transduction histidine kinase/CheY-like chemotaxis protein
METEATRLREQVTANDPLATDLICNMAHELRAPLNRVLGFSRLIARDESISTKHRQQLNIINRNGEHLFNLINDFLDLSKMEAGRATVHPVEFDLCKFLDDVSLLVVDDAHSRALRFNPMVDESVKGLWIVGDKDKLRQVLLNLLGNAIKYTKGHHVTLGVQAKDVKHGSATLSIDVEDSGPAIPQDKLAVIFRPFERLDSVADFQSGTGLGLTITKSLVELMGGTVSVINTKRGGNRFTVVLPVQLVPASLEANEESSRVVPDRLSEGQPEFRVLVVEGDADSRTLLITHLSGLGFSVQEARDDTEALNIFRQWQPHFVWMDAKSGSELARSIRSLPGGNLTRIAALTDIRFTNHPGGALGAEFDDCINKPFHEDDLLEVMRKHLQLRFDYRSSPANPKVYIQIRADDFIDLSPELLERMLVAVEKSHNFLMHLLIDEIPEGNIELAKANELRLLVDTYEWGQIENLLNSAKEKQAQGLINPN